jgi:alkaline phosphatase D
VDPAGSEPLALDSSGGMPSRKVQVEWEVATDERCRHVVRRGKVNAVPEIGHSVHVEVSGLHPSTTYFYRFRAMGEISPLGRTKTAPARGSSPAQVRFGVVSCQVWYEGFFTAYQHMASDDLDVVFHLGDYIYENPIPIGGLYRQVDLATGLREEPWFLNEYRNRYALGLIDPDLQAAQAAFPFVATWDDHEVENNWAGDVSQVDEEPDQDRAVFRQRRARAAQAYYEHLPLRLPQRPMGEDVRLFRRLRYGNLATFHVLDSRMFRADQACGDGIKIDCAERLDPTRPMLGGTQEEWLYDGMGRSGTTWNVLANQVCMSQIDTNPDAPQALVMDFWDGYKPARDRLFNAFAERQVANPVVLTGDMHRHLAADLKANFDDQSSRTLGVEFVGTSITSGRDGVDLDPSGAQILGTNPHVKFTSFQRGYVRCTATPELCRGEFQTLDYVSLQGSPIKTRITLVTEAGNPGIQVESENPPQV